MAILIDFLTYSITGFPLMLFPYFIHKMKLDNFILSLVAIYIINQSIVEILIFLIMFFIDKITFKYLNYNVLLGISLYTFFYMILSDIDIYFFINLIIVILLIFKKYNISGDFNDLEKEYI